MTARRGWERREQMLALELYMTTPFGRIHARNPDIISLAERIGRTPGAVALKMSNFVALDPTIDRSGMGNYSQSDAGIWQEFFADPLAFVSTVETFRRDPQDFTISSQPAVESGWELREGTDRVVTSRARSGQSFFRRMLMANYEGKCAVTSISEPDLLLASHIAPWSTHAKARLNPNNGILLNALHDRAFDRGLISFEDNLDMVVSPQLELAEDVAPFFEGRKLRLPVRSLPDPAFLQHHREHIFRRHAA